MGVCHSQLERQSSNVGVGADGDVYAVKKNQNHHIHLPSKSTPSRSSTFGGIKVAYDLALISPSDKTDVTQMISPSSQLASPFFSPQGKKAVVKEEDDGFPSDEEFDDQDSVVDIQLTFDEPELGTDVEKKDGDDHKYRFEDHSHFNGCFLKTEDEPTYSEETRNDHEEMPDRDQFRQLCTPPDPTGTDTEIEAYTCSSPDIIVTDDDNHLRSYPMASSKPDHPPLLAPPKNATFSSPVPYSSTINPLTIATFNKIKTQAEQAQSLQKKHRQEEKLMDRRRDIKGYRELWGEFSEIKEQVHQHREEVIKSPNVGCENVSLNDSTTWYVDFSALNSMNHFDDQEIEDNGVLDNEDDQKSQASLSLLSEHAFYAQKKLYQQKTAQRLKNMSAYSIGSKKGDTTPAPSSNFGDNDIDVNENENDDEQDDKSIIMNDNSSVISDLDNGSVVDIDNNDDYGVGVLHRYSCKSIESSVTEFQPHHQVLEDTDAFLSAATPRKANCATPSIFLPSVSIENSEIRWRKFPEADKKVRVARKIDFSVEDSNEGIESSNMGKMDEHDVTSAQSECESNIDIDVKSSDGDGDGDEGTNVSFPAEGEKILEPEPNGILNGYSGSILGTTIKEDECSTVEIVENEDEMSPSSENSINQEEEKKGVKLARKIGPQLHGLLDQLKENGLGK
jgi:hypothetical protein